MPTHLPSLASLFNTLIPFTFIANAALFLENA
jgi:hypothetical protein